MAQTPPQMERPRIAIVTRRQRIQYFVEQLGNGVEMEMVRIPGGSFVMGEPGSDDQHRVEIQPFCMGKYLVTQAQWRAVAAMEPIEQELKLNPSHFEGDDLPVEQVNWYEAVEFCQRLSRNHPRDYRLPSGAEWEYACRAGTTTLYHFGEVIAQELANYYGGNHNQTTPVGSFGVANAFGLYDMHGNVWEWCTDHGHENYRGAPTDGSAWIEGGDSSLRMLRGGSWDDGPEDCHSAYRIRDYANGRLNSFGFRVVCSTLREG